MRFSLVVTVQPPDQGLRAFLIDEAVNDLYPDPGDDCHRVKNDQMSRTERIPLNRFAPMSTPMPVPHIIIPWLLGSLSTEVETFGIKSAMLCSSVADIEPNSSNFMP